MLPPHQANLIQIASWCGGWLLWRIFCFSSSHQPETRCKKRVTLQLNLFGWMDFTWTKCVLVLFAMFSPRCSSYLSNFISNRIKFGQKTAQFAILSKIMSLGATIGQRLYWLSNGKYMHHNVSMWYLCLRVLIESHLETAPGLGVN